MEKPKHNSFVEEKITVIRPTSSNHIFNDEKYSRLESYDAETGEKVVVLREKIKEDKL